MTRDELIKEIIDNGPHRPIEGSCGLDEPVLEEWHAEEIAAICERYFLEHIEVRER